MEELSARLRERSGLDPGMTAGGVALFVASLTAFGRMEDNWAEFPLLGLVAVPCLLLLTLALLPEREGFRGGRESLASPSGVRLSGWQTAYLLGALVLLAFSLAQLVVVLSDGNPGGATGTWIFALLALLAGVMARRYDVPAATLLACVSAVFAVIAFADWTGDGAGSTTVRDILLVAGIGFLVLARAARSDHLRHSHLLAAVGAAALMSGAAIGAIGEFDLGFFLFGSELGSEPQEGGDGWKLILIAVAVGSLSYGALQAHRGSGYVGIAGLIGFYFLIGDGDLAGWPLLLGAAAAACIAYSLRRPALAQGSDDGHPREPTESRTEGPPR